MTDVVSWLSARLDADAEDHSDGVHRCEWGDFWTPGWGCEGPCKPARTVAAHRAILNLALATEDRSLHADAWWVGQEMIRQLASIYEGRDGWDPAWKVGP